MAGLQNRQSNLARPLGEDKLHTFHHNGPLACATQLPRQGLHALPDCSSWATPVRRGLC